MRTWGVSGPTGYAHNETGVRRGNVDTTYAETPRLISRCYTLHQVNPAAGFQFASLSMPSRRIHRGALVGLGALLLVLTVWPFVCVAAIPVPLMLPAEPTSTQPIPRTASSQPPTLLSVLLNATTTHTNSSITELRTQPPPTRLQSAPNQYANHTLITQYQPRTVSTTVGDTRTHREPSVNTDQRIVTVKSEQTTSTHDEIEFKFKSFETAPTAEPKLERSQSPSHRLLVRTIEMPDMHQSNADASPTTIITSIVDHQVNNNDDLHVTTNFPRFLEESTRESSSTAIAVLMQAASPSAPHAQSGRQRSHRSVKQDVHLTHRKRKSHLDRNERSANMSHIKGTARKIQLLVKNRLIQILPDGTVNGTQDYQSEYSELNGHSFIHRIQIIIHQLCINLRYEYISIIFGLNGHCY